MITTVFLAIMVVFSVYCFYERAAIGKYMFHPFSIHHKGEHYRFLTHAFIHGDLIHLAFNCIALFTFGRKLENVSFPALFGDKLGQIYYILLFTGGIYAASVTEYLRNRHNPDYASLGASGAISSVMFCFIMVSPLKEVNLFMVSLPGWIAGGLLLGASYFLIRRKRSGKYNDNISHESHYWGALFGVAFILVAKPALGKLFIMEIMNAF